VALAAKTGFEDLCFTGRALLEHGRPYGLDCFDCGRSRPNSTRTKNLRMALLITFLSSIKAPLWRFRPGHTCRFASKIVRPPPPKLIIRKPTRGGRRRSLGPHALCLVSYAFLVRSLITLSSSYASKSLARFGLGFGPEFAHQNNNRLLRRHRRDGGRNLPPAGNSVAMTALGARAKRRPCQLPHGLSSSSSWCQMAPLSTRQQSWKSSQFGRFSGRLAL